VDNGEHLGTGTVRTRGAVGQGRHHFAELVQLVGTFDRGHFYSPLTTKNATLDMPGRTGALLTPIPHNQRLLIKTNLFGPSFTPRRALRRAGSGPDITFITEIADEEQ
jgi:hypothetical protein